MPDVFINYRTGDAKDTAYRVHEELSRRFGKERVFLAGVSIEAGDRYANELVQSVRRSGALLALIGHGWLDAPDRKRPGGRALDNEEDWVRRELEEAFAWAVPVIPVLIGRQAEQLDPLRLPESIADLAECQYIRYSPRTARDDLALLGDRLAKLVPALSAADKGRLPNPETALEPPARADGMSTSGQQGGIGNVGSNTGTLIGHADGPLNTGTGNQILGDQVNGNKILGDQVNGDQVAGTQIKGATFSGDGVMFAAGDVRDGVHQQFGPLRRRRKADDEG